MRPMDQLKGKGNRKQVKKVIWSIVCLSVCWGPPSEFVWERECVVPRRALVDDAVSMVV